jgi:NADH-quinone oxidoreductase subunit E
MDLLERTFPDQVRAAIAMYPPGRQASAVLQLLYLAQTAYGELSPAAIDDVARLLDMDATQVRGLVGFYALLYEEFPGGYVIHYCTDLPCALRGAEDLFPVLCQKLGLDGEGRSPDGLFRVEKAMCLAACDRAPVMQVNLEYCYDLTPETLDSIVADLRARAAADPPRRLPFGFGPASDLAPAATGGHNGRGHA